MTTNALKYGDDKVIIALLPFQKDDTVFKISILIWLLPWLNEQISPYFDKVQKGLKVLLANLLKAIWWSELMFLLYKNPDSSEEDDPEPAPVGG